MEWNNIEFSSLHLGLTYKCTLSCLECARTHAPKHKISDIVNTMHLDWKQYKSLINEVNPRLIELCGNWGDPIYYPDLIPLIKYIKKRNKLTYIVLHTNGSYRPASFWNELAKVMNKRDEIYFSIDGTREKYTKYRVNSNLKSIDTALRTLNKIPRTRRPTLTQKTIFFSYVKWDIIKIINEARFSGFDKIRFEWPHVDNNLWLTPNYNIEWVERHLRKNKIPFKKSKLPSSPIIKDLR
jgi:wyosine [tRNA(Phe)-imidazoG37] synthetase (radical SAM superfamily)